MQTCDSLFYFILFYFIILFYNIHYWNHCNNHMMSTQSARTIINIYTNVQHISFNITIYYLFIYLFNELYLESRNVWYTMSFYNFTFLYIHILGSYHQLNQSIIHFIYPSIILYYISPFMYLHHLHLHHLHEFHVEISIYTDLNCTTLNVH